MYIDKDRVLRDTFRSINRLKVRLKEVNNTSINIEYHNVSTEESQPIDYIDIETYPKYYKIIYHFSRMYVRANPFQIFNNVSYTFWLSSAGILDFYKSQNPSFTDICEIMMIDKDVFDEDVIPFNSSISKSWIFPQNKLLLENIHKYGIIYLIVAWGALLNQEESVMDNDDAFHLDATAFEFGADTLKKEPLNIINWPFSLKNPEADRYNFERLFNGRMINIRPSNPKPEFTIGPQKEENNCIKFTFGNKK